ncbi:hypothetical protein LENED_007112 [Lentinula edodes]|uniref:Uncharacterized protein n=1 Tax=Lentinula edodes TaxID=5353 RepID=A0A1Q3EDL3_LENED|nr:hypothetical protein LENED_007112 [Lentinula edodes]
MLDERDTADADQQELQKFLALQQDEAAVAAKHKRNCSPLPMAGPSSKKVRLDASKKSVAEAQSGLVQQPIVPPSTRTPIKGTGPDLLSSNMPPASRPTLVPRALAAHPYRAENQCLAARVWLLESQLADSQWENSSLTSALWDTSHALESRQQEVEQLRSSSHEVLEHETEYRRVLDQFIALDEALPGTPGQSLLEHFQKVQKDLRDATRECKISVEKLSSSTRKNSQLTTTLLYQQGLVDESNALATCQRRLVEKLQEEVHRGRDCAALVEQMVKEYPDEGYYEVVLPPLSQLEGDLNKAREDLRRVATLAHRLHCSDPATVLHHHHRYMGRLSKLWSPSSVVGWSLKTLILLPTTYIWRWITCRRLGVHGISIWSISSIQWFFNNAVDEDEGLYRLVLEHSRFDNDSPFLTAAQHAGFAPPPDNSLEPPLHRRMLALSTALPHSDGVGRWDDLVPALPSVDQLTVDWEQLMLRYIHHITDVPLSGTDTQVPMSSVEPGTESLAEVTVEQLPEAPPLFLPEQESPTSPSPPPTSPTLPPPFASLANLTIDLTGDDDDLYETEESRMARVSMSREVVDSVAVQSVVKEEPL